MVSRFFSFPSLEMKFVYVIVTGSVLDVLAAALDAAAGAEAAALDALAPVLAVVDEHAVSTSAATPARPSAPVSLRFMCVPSRGCFVVVRGTAQRSLDP